jgi:hypothetical protein
MLHPLPTIVLTLCLCSVLAAAQKSTPWRKLQELAGLMEDASLEWGLGKRRRSGPRAGAPAGQPANR